MIVTDLPKEVLEMVFDLLFNEGGPYVKYGNVNEYKLLVRVAILDEGGGIGREN